MQRVSSLGGPRVLLPTKDVGRWIAELGETPTPDEGLYSLACSVEGYCGVISPWETPLLIFGDEPVDIYLLPDEFDGLLFRWLAAESLDQLTEFAIAEAHADHWDEVTAFPVSDRRMTVMDTCTFDGDTAPQIHFELELGEYSIKSRYAESASVMCIVHRLEQVR